MRRRWKNPSRGSRITRLAEWSQTVIAGDGFFYLTLTPMIDSFSYTHFISERILFNKAVTSIAEVHHIVIALLWLLMTTLRSVLSQGLFQDFLIWCARKCQSAFASFKYNFSFIMIWAHCKTRRIGKAYINTNSRDQTAYMSIMSVCVLLLTSFWKLSVMSKRLHALSYSIW